MSIYETDCEEGCLLLKVERDKLEAIKTHLESYPDERDEEKYSIGRHYPSTAGPRIFNSVLFLTHLETWHKQLKKILGVEG